MRRGVGIALTLSLLGVARQLHAGEAEKAGTSPAAVSCPAVDPTPRVASEGNAAKVSARGAGLMAFVDPATGKLVEPSAADLAAFFARNPELRKALSTSTEGLTEVPLPGGGYKVDLQGRFRSTIVATVGPDGKPRLGHLVVTPPQPVTATPARAAEGDRK